VEEALAGDALVGAGGTSPSAPAPAAVEDVPGKPTKRALAASGGIPHTRTQAQASPGRGRRGPVGV